MSAQMQPSAPTLSTDAIMRAGVWPTLVALVVAGVGTNQSSGTSLNGKRLVETTPMFSNTLERYALIIKKRREAPQHFRIWLSCAS